MGLILVIVGLILLLAGASWFAGAATVGAILLVAGIVLTVLQFAIMAFMGRSVRARQREFFDRL